MKYALFVAREPLEVDGDYFCVLDSAEDVSNQVHDPVFAERFLTDRERMQIEHGFPVNIECDQGIVCIRPFE